MITKEEILYIANLARIFLPEKDDGHFTKNLEDILRYIEKLKQLDVTGVNPTSHVLSLKNVFRDDVIKPSLSQQDALKIAVAQHQGSFKVPRIIEQ